MATNKEAFDDEKLRQLDQLATLLDSQYKIPGTDIRVGLDGLIGLIPGIGDAATTALSLYIIARAANYGVSKSCIIHMIWNVLVDTIVGTVPVLGDIFDVGWKANRKNLDLLISEINTAKDRQV